MDCGNIRNGLRDRRGKRWLGCGEKCLTASNGWGLRRASSRLGWVGEAVEGAADALAAAVEDVSVDHGCAHVAVAQEFLDGPDVAVVLQQVRGKRMTQGVTRGSFRDPGPAYGVLDGALHD